ncbi:MAG: extracellular solute-binding protein [Christensenellales bacterium]|jgi:multiple sugar transport system substrate-binding protein
MKKLIPLFLALLMVLTVAPVIAEEEVTLSIMMSGSWIPGGPVHSSTGEISQVVTKILPEFEKRHPNVKLEFEQLQGDTDGYNSYLLRGAAGTLPDISMLDGYWVAAFASQGYTYAMNGRIDQAILDDYYDAFEMMYKGETHGLVYSTAYNGVVWYRTSMLEAAGYTEMPSDWDGFWTAIEKMAEVNDVYGMAMSMAVTEATTCSMLAPYWAGEDVFVDDDNVAQFNNETSVRIFNKLKEEFDKGILPPESLTLNYDGAQDLFNKGMSATLVHGSWRSTYWENNVDFADDVAIAMWPKDPNTGISSQNAGGWSFAITTPDTTKDEYINTFLELMLTDPEYALLRIGEDGEIPVTQTIGALECDWIPEQYRAAIMGELPTSKTRPVVASYPVASEYWTQAMQKVVMGEATAEDALAEAVKKLEEYVFDADL